MPRSGMIATPIALGLCVMLLSASPARAQSTEWSDRAFLNVNLGFQLTARPFTEQLTPVIYTERALIAATHAGKGGKFTLDVAGGVHLWRNLGVGGAYTKFAATETPVVDARVPHPSFFNQPRTASKAAPFQRAEAAIHIQALFVIPVSSKLDVSVSAGPSLIDVRQDLVQSIEVAEVGAPFTSVAIGNVAVLTREVRVFGINIGADVTWFVTPIAGIGITARYVGASAATQLSGGGPIDLDLGGFQVGWGARIRLR
jgi:hypothetical protein